MTVALSSGELLKLLGYSSSSGAENEKGAAMTLEERLALAREIAARTKPQFVIDDSRHELRRLRFEKVKARSKAPAKRKPKRP